MMAEYISTQLIQRFDSLASSPLARDRTFYFSFKRALDVMVAALVLVIAAPLMALVALLVLLDSGWPIIYSQKRVGVRRWSREGYGYWQRSTFSCFKFRSMVRNADPAVHQAFVAAFIHNDQTGMAALQGGNGDAHKLVNDPRVTRMGSVLRKTSLDELPQLWNVLKGDMSLVGPRPDVPYSVEQYESWHYARLSAQPGLSGLWQVDGRSSVAFDDMVRKDIEYADSQSLWLDIKIILLTIPAVLAGRGAV